MKAHETSSTMIPQHTVKVTFRGHTYWLLADHGVGRSLAPLDHCDQQGHIKLRAMFEPSFGHIFPDDDRIKRFGQVIGTASELELA